MTKKKLSPAKAAVIHATKAPGAFVEKFDKYALFFAAALKSFGPFREGQVDGFTHILNQWSAAKLEDVRWLSYMLATTWHETATTMQPITEYGSTKYLRGKKYWPYIGRGFVQLTWKANYQKYGIANDPLRALDPDFAAHVMIDGMTKGIFTGKRLDQYFNAKKEDAVGARRIINGTDKAQMIAGYYFKFKACLKTETLAPALT